MQYLITPLLEVLNPTNTVSRNRLLSFAIGNMEAEIYNCLIAKHVYYNNQGKLHEGGWFYSTVKDLHLSSGYAEDAQKSAIRHVLIIVRNYAIFHEMQIILSIVLLQDIKKYIVLNQE